MAWSVSTEWFFYIAYPLIRVLIEGLETRKMNILAAAALVFIGLGGMSIVIANVDRINAHAVAMFGPIGGGGPYGQDFFFRWLVYFSPYSRIFEFMLGCLVASIYMS